VDVLKQNFARMGLVAALLVAMSTLTGCTSRGITVTSVPPGAEVSINHRVVGVTPIRVGFTHYGTYRIELRKEKYQVLVREESINPPVYGYDPIAAVADNLVPARLNDEVYLHYIMKGLEDKAEKADAGEKDALSDRDALMERALAARDGRVTHPKTGQQYDIALKRESSKSTVAQTPEAEGTLIASNTKDKPSDLEPVVKDIQTPVPQGVRLATELNLNTPPKDKAPGAFVNPADVADTKKSDASKVIRTPKDEELIFDKPDFTDKDEKKEKEKEAEKKPAAPKKK
jgi:hypothetical protein